MVAAVLKIYFIGTALSVLAVLFGLADSFGGLMYVQEDIHYILELDHRTETKGGVSSGDHQRSSVTKNIGS